MVISDRWSMYREDVEKVEFVKEKLLDDLWWDKVEYIIASTKLIYDMLKMADTDKPTLHLVYDMWDSMIEKVKEIIYRNDGKREDDDSTFYKVVYEILVQRWNKSNTPLHCLAHSLNLRYYSHTWLIKLLIVFLHIKMRRYQMNGINALRNCFQALKKGN